MESVGRLAGGVAHDFNNMLGVILGYTEMVLAKTDRSDPRHNDLKEVLAAGKRSADIVRQLLAFARKQKVSPGILDLNGTIDGILKMLRRLIGEDINLTWRPSADRLNQGYIDVESRPGEGTTFKVYLPRHDDKAIAAVEDSKISAPTGRGEMILVMSGYTASVIADQGVLDDGTNFLRKPFSAVDLAVKVREVLMS
ncbi:MAG: PAS/PAC sensor hybrid histidine kinase [uncultured bacterium]|nr:MAG: PAS/PAC sensor hybrid histidine kinase [uncultured bacterium]